MGKTLAKEKQTFPVDKSVAPAVTFRKSNFLTQHSITSASADEFFPIDILSEFLW